MPTEQQVMIQNLDDAIDLLARVRHLGLLPEDDRHGDLAHDVDAFIEQMDEHNHIGASPRCRVCGRMTEIESWDTPVEYCPNDCDLSDQS